jgi:hypothetical protein
MKNTLAIVALAACVSALCRTAGAAPVPESLLACRKLPDENQRVRCYDAQIDKMTGSVAAASPSAAAKFGEETLPSNSRPTTPKEDTALLSSITAKQTVGSNIYAFALANGQVWRQEEASQASLFFRVGDNVRIEKGTMGSYHMSTASSGAKNWVRVTRIK